MSADFVRKTYGVPAKRGGRVRFNYRETHEGTIVSFPGPYIGVRFDEDPGRTVKLHPTWNVEYLSEAASR